jgi:hypothetical protein
MGRRGMGEKGKKEAGVNVKAAKLQGKTANDANKIEG